MSDCVDLVSDDEDAAVVSICSSSSDLDTAELLVGDADWWASFRKKQEDLTPPGSAEALGVIDVNCDLHDSVLCDWFARGLPLQMLKLIFLMRHHLHVCC